ncbi:hypothetical protein [Streptomyces sp.]|uniref:hypothetical protein n=1 Tax=Streptomyces sp. TaxID=1931 RepID=UPI002F4032D9
MNANARTARATLRQRTRTQRAASRIARRGSASLTTHAMATGLAPTQARTVASSLRRNARKLGITGAPARVHAGRHMRTTTRFTPAQVAAIAAVYRPRKAVYQAAAARLALAA